MPEPAGLGCCCLAEDGKPPRRSLACPQHGCYCGTGRTYSEHRGAHDDACPTHGARPAAVRVPESFAAVPLPPLDPDGLTDVDRDILDHEKKRWKYQGAKEAEARVIIAGRSAGPGTASAVTHYYQRLNQLIDHPPAIAAEPALCARLREQRQDRNA